MKEMREKKAPRFRVGAGVVVPVTEVEKTQRGTDLGEREAEGPVLDTLSSRYLLSIKWRKK